MNARRWKLKWLPSMGLWALLVVVVLIGISVAQDAANRNIIAYEDP